MAALDAEVAQNLGLMARQQQRAIRLEKELEQARESQTAALAELRNSIASRSSAMTQLETQQSELQQLIEEITRALEGVSSFDQIRPWPSVAVSCRRRWMSRWPMVWRQLWRRQPGAQGAVVRTKPGQAGAGRTRRSGGFC